MSHNDVASTGGMGGGVKQVGGGPEGPAAYLFYCTHSALHSITSWCLTKILKLFKVDGSASLFQFCFYGLSLFLSHASLYL